MKSAAGRAASTAFASPLRARNSPDFSFTAGINLPLLRSASIRSPDSANMAHAAGSTLRTASRAMPVRSNDSLAKLAVARFFGTAIEVLVKTGTS